MRRRVCCWALVATLAGCGGPDLGPVARVPVAERHILTAGSPAGVALSLPGDRAFVIHIKQSTQNLGSSGQARGESDSTAQGRAFAAAQAENGGSATADFKLGHRIDNASAVTQVMTARIDFALEQTLDASEVPAPATLAKADLKLLVVDSHQRVVSSTVLVQATTDDSVGSASIPQQRHLLARLEPGESYDVVLYGKVDATAADQQKSSTRLDVDGLKMSFTFSPATTRPAGTQPKL